MNVARVKFKWETNRWDGPLSGVAEIDGELVWFDTLDAGGWRRARPGEASSEDEDDDSVCDPRIFNVYRIRPDLMAEECARHQEFREIVGTHCDYGADGKRLRDDGYAGPKPGWRAFFDKYPPEPKANAARLLDGAVLLGTFSWETMELQPADPAVDPVGELAKRDPTTRVES